MSVLELDIIKAISEDEKEENMRSNDTNTTEDREGTNMIQTLSSSGPTPEPFKTNAERRTQSSEQDVDALEIIQGTEEMSLSSESEKNKPWMKVGANISDYFNYGFDEESWDAYCKKQATLRDVNGKLFPKLLPQMWNTGNEEEQPCCAYSSFDRPASRINIASNATIDVSVGQPGLSSRKEGRRCLSHGNSAQVVTEMSHKADLSPPSNTNSLFAVTSPPLILFRSGPPASSPTSVLNRGHLKDMDSALTSLHPQSSESMAVSVGMIDAAKAWEYMWQQKCDKCGDKSREQGRDKGRNRKKESSSSSHNSGEEQLKHRDTAEQGHKRRSSEKISGEKRHKSEGWHKTSQSNSRSRSSSSSSSRNRKDDGEDRDSRHKHKGQEK